MRITNFLTSTVIVAMAGMFAHPAPVVAQQTPPVLSASTSAPKQELSQPLPRRSDELRVAQCTPDGQPCPENYEDCCSKSCGYIIGPNGRAREGLFCNNPY
jgi:hypothetical protein